MAKSAWITHLMQTRKNMPKGASLGDAMKAAKKTYKKMSKSIIGGVGDKPLTEAEEAAKKDVVPTAANTEVPPTTGGARTCRGRSITQCYHDKRHCKYAKGTKRQFCRRKTSRNSRKSRK